MSNSLRPHGLQHSRLPWPSLSPRACSNSCPLSRWCHPTVSSSVTPFSCPQPVAKVLELQLQYQSLQWIFRVDVFQDRLDWSPCSPRDSQESSPTPQLYFLAKLNFLQTYHTMMLPLPPYLGSYWTSAWNSLSPCSALVVWPASTFSGLMSRVTCSKKSFLKTSSIRQSSLMHMWCVYTHMYTTQWMPFWWWLLCHSNMLYPPDSQMVWSCAWVLVTFAPAMVHDPKAFNGCWTKPFSYLS